MTRIGMHFSLWGAGWTREAAEQAVPEAARYGLEVIEIPLLVPGSIDVGHARDLLAANGIAPSASLCLPPDRRASEHPAAARDFLLEALEVAHALGCTFLGGVTYSALGYKTGAAPTEAEYAAIAEALRPAAARAAELGMTLGLEPCNRYETHLLNTAAQTLALLDRIGAANTAVHLDTYHMNIEEKGIGTGLRLAAGRAPYIHLSESDRGVPGSGTIDWEDVFATLAATGFAGDLVVESFVTLPPEIAAALCVWRPVARDRYEVLDQGVSYLRRLARNHRLIP
ncbi:MAG: sugar phosphate isomerase/epimerase [Alphaproteobacteria bacterium]|nr:sugar phosphate isomerase/epimerase [Alphaproteobacteria bacterium]